VPTWYFGTVCAAFTRSLRELELWRGEFSTASRPSPRRKGRPGQTEVVPFSADERIHAADPAAEVVPFDHTSVGEEVPGASDAPPTPRDAAAPSLHSEMDFTEVYASYALMKSALRGVNATFEWFFFGAEFTLVLLVIIGSVASYHEVAVFLAAPEDTGSTLALLRVVVTVSNLVFDISLVWSLLVRAAAMTDAARQVRNRAHALCLHFAASRQFDLLDEATRFKDLVDDEMSSLGFGFAGVVVSPAFVATIGYAVLSVGTAIGSILVDKHLLSK